MTGLQSLFEKHKDTLDKAVAAIHARTFHAHWPEIPSGKIYGETANADGEAAFKAVLNKRFEALGQPEPLSWHGSEESPYGFPLGIEYPVFAPEALVERSKKAFHQWRKLTASERAGILIEALEQSSKNFFTIAYATMHTTGQGFMMAFQASGPHGYDRALEAVALGHHELMRFPESVRWDKPMGKMTISLEKRFHSVPRGVGLVIACSTFPTWNSLPGMFADLVTGNTVIVKPHQKVILPLAIVVADLRRVLTDNSIDPDVVQLAVDGESLIAKQLAEHPDVRLIDYTGGTAFGDYLEGLRGKIVFTEKAGVNSLLLDSVENFDAAIENITMSLCLYSGQMCTTPQNIFIPKGGVKEGDATIPYEEVVRRLTASLDGLAGNEKLGPPTLGAIQNDATTQRVESVHAFGCPVLRDAKPVTQVGFENARSFSPALLEVPAGRVDILTKELFGPIALIVPTDSTQQSVELASKTAREAGAITFSAYCTDAAVRESIEDTMALAGAAISFNLTGPIWVNQSATFSDFHVSGGNPSGNASLTDPAFIVRRFFVVGSRIPVRE